MIDALTIAALTVYGEARGEPDLGKVAVAWVIRNRAEHPRWWGHDIRSVCISPNQFSCWSGDESNDANMTEMQRQVDHPTALFLECKRIVVDVFDNKISDPTGGADHYLLTSAVSKVSWSKGKTPTAVIGAHSFFRLEL